ncbi:YcgL domain-containing protein, partial [Salmonella enterica subsp. enterica serovar Cerro]|nr:YcgL domain-containing protein [Salmonella enterica subsp. enterica serovar Cerro]
MAVSGRRSVYVRNRGRNYSKKKDDFSRVPEALMKGFGQPQLAMMLPLDGRKKLVNAELEKV